MSQTWHLPLLTTDTLSDSRTYLNDAYEALRTMFSGATAPSTPVAGQLFYDTDDKLIYVYDGATWRLIGDANLTNLGLLPKAGGSGNAMSGALYMGSQQVKGMANPTASTDAVNVAYADATYAKLAGATFTGPVVMGTNKLTSSRSVPDDNTELVRKDYADLKLAKTGGAMAGNLDINNNLLYGIPTATSGSSGDTAVNCSYLRNFFDTGSSGHDHDAVDSKRVLATNLDTTGNSSGLILTSNASGAQLVKMFDMTTVASKSFAGSYAWEDLIELTMYVPRATTRLFVKCFFKYSGVLRSTWRVQNASDTVLYTCSTPTSYGISGSYGQTVEWYYLFTPGAAGNFTATIQGSPQTAETLSGIHMFGMTLE